MWVNTLSIGPFFVPKNAARHKTFNEILYLESHIIENIELLGITQSR